MKSSILRTIDGPPAVLFVQLIRCPLAGEPEETLVDIAVCAADEASVQSLRGALAHVAAGAGLAYAEAVGADARAIDGACRKQHGPVAAAARPGRKSKSNGDSVSARTGTRKAAAGAASNR
jgi:hypothetical protein